MAGRAMADCATPFSTKARPQERVNKRQQHSPNPAIFHLQDTLTAIITNVACSRAGSIEDSSHGMANSSDECPIFLPAEQLQRLRGRQFLYVNLTLCTVVFR